MKKLISIITAAAAVLAAVPMAASAEDERNYTPTVYFTADAKEPVLALPGGALYVNSAKISDSAVKLPAKVFIKDKYKHAGQIAIKWTWDTDYVYTSDIRNPSSEGGSAAYTEYNVSGNNDPIAYYNVAGEKMMGLNYSNTLPTALTPSGAESDTNPLGLFNLNIAKNAPADYYNINFKTTQPYITTIVLRYAEGSPSYISTYPEGEFAPSLKIGVSDRELGDINNDGVLDGRDATDILSEYALRSANKDGKLDKAQTIAADVTGNGIVDGIDATSVLTYYALTSSGNKDTFIEFLTK